MVCRTSGVSGQYNEGVWYVGGGREGGGIISSQYFRGPFVHVSYDKDYDRINLHGAFNYSAFNNIVFVQRPE